MSQRSQGRKRIKYTIYSPRELAQIGKLGSIYRPKGAARYYKRKTRIDINERTVCNFKEAYEVERKCKRQREEDHAVTELHPENRGRKLLLGKKIDSVVQEYILKLRAYGCPVDTYVPGGILLRL